jgi:predicted lactoylglutathione lyase
VLSVIVSESPTSAGSDFISSRIAESTAASSIVSTISAASVDEVDGDDE